MLRNVIIFLVLLNLGWLAWAQDWLSPIGFGTNFADNSQIMGKQIRPDTMQIKPWPPGMKPLLESSTDVNAAMSGGIASATSRRINRR
jgi:hypothetical protein